jgi:hypothetical protein
MIHIIYHIFYYYIFYNVSKFFTFKTDYYYGINFKSIPIDFKNLYNYIFAYEIDTVYT